MWGRKDYTFGQLPAMILIPDFRTINALQEWWYGEVRKTNSPSRHYIVAGLEEFLVDVMRWPLSEQYLFFKKLQVIMLRKQCDIRKYQEKANDIERIKLLLTWRKEEALREILTLVPYVGHTNDDSLIIYLRILPAFLSYVTLYDMEVNSAMKILKILRFHPSLENYQDIFGQWYFVFHRRLLLKKNFQYKDESCVRDLPTLSLKNCKYDVARGIGYADVYLFRSFHRWLRLLRLHKYLFFFASLSYADIIHLEEASFDEHEKKLNIIQVTIGAKSKILREIDRLRQRRQSLENILNTHLNRFDEIDKAVRDIKKILRTPIPVNDNDLGEDIPQWLVTTMHKIFNSILANLNVDENSVSLYGLFISLLKEAWNYNIFTAVQKEKFNEWRTRLSDNMKNWNVREFCGVEKTGEVGVRPAYAVPGTEIVPPVISTELNDANNDNNNNNYEPSIGNMMIDTTFLSNYEYALINIGRLTLNAELW